MKLSEKELFLKVLNALYPVGSIYISTVSTSPEILLGGSWRSIHGRFLVAEGNNGASGNQALNLAAGSTGGEKNHQLTTNEMPAHSHKIWYSWTSGTSSNWAITVGGNKTDQVQDTSRGIQNTGGNAVHNNMPPYLAVYMWERIA